MFSLLRELTRGNDRGQLWRPLPPTESLFTFTHNHFTKKNRWENKSYNSNTILGEGSFIPSWCIFIEVVPSDQYWLMSNPHQDLNKPSSWQQLLKNLHTTKPITAFLSENANMLRPAMCLIVWRRIKRMKILLRILWKFHSIILIIQFLAALCCECFRSRYIFTGGAPGCNVH